MTRTANLGRPSLRAAAGQIQGRRVHQEDSLRVHPDGEAAIDDRVVAVIADGMGGHEGGDVASRAAADGFLRQHLATSDAPARAALQASLRAANEAISAERAAGRGGPDMGSTLLGVQANRTDFAWISVGDSPLYIWTEVEGLRRLNEDHSMAPVIDQMARQGIISAEDAAHDPDRHALRSAVGLGEIALTDGGVAAWPDRAALVLASDGLNVLPETEIAAALSAAAEDPARAVALLMEAVERAGDPDQDNASVVVIHRAPGALVEEEVEGPRTAVTGRMGLAVLAALVGLGLLLMLLFMFRRRLGLP